MKRIIVGILVLTMTVAFGQDGYWQQEVNYVMDIDFDVDKHQYDGKQTLTYTNNSPDTLHNVFYHLYFNAFQPGSMMDVRSRTIQDPDARVGSRIAALKENEIGFQRITSLIQDGTKLKYETVGTVLEVELAKPILPGEKTVFEMEWKAQVPIQIRRSGRDNAEGISYSMTQWYPKLAEYDHMGWHANPYVGREFHGVWGDFEVNITMDSRYKMGATGILTNRNQIGYGFQDEGKEQPVLDDKVTWKWKAENVIDFAWASDPEYEHLTYTASDGTVMHFLYQPDEEINENWQKLPGIMAEAIKFMNKHYGEYQFPQYTFIQGGDGGMEYPMITLITGGRSLTGLVSVSVHEWMHSWYQFTLATNESLYAWMDEGFTSFAQAEIMNHLRGLGLIPGQKTDQPYANSVNGYTSFSQSGMEEPLSIHSDHFKTNRAYGRAAYTKGSVFLTQLEYIMGEAAFRRGLKRYFNEWKFKHPTPNDLLRIMEKESGLELDWFKEYFVYTTKFIDFAISNVKTTPDGTLIELTRLGEMPMPIEIEIKTTDGRSFMHYIPMVIMRGEKRFQDADVQVHADWQWTNQTYELIVPQKISDMEMITIDPSGRMADVDRRNNTKSM